MMSLENNNNNESNSKYYELLPNEKKENIDKAVKALEKFEKEGFNTVVLSNAGRYVYGAKKSDIQNQSDFDRYSPIRNSAGDFTTDAITSLIESIENDYKY